MLAVVFSARVAAAETQIHVPEGCGSDAEWRVELERLTGAPAASAASVELQIAPLAPGSGFELQLSLDGERRVLRDPVCRVLWRSALVIAASRYSAAPPGAPANPSSAEPPAPVPPTPVPPASVPSTPAAQAPAGRASDSAPSTPLRVEPSAAPPATRPVARGATARISSRAVPRTQRPRAATEPRTAPAVATGTSAADAGNDGWRLGVGLGIGISGGVVPGWGPVLEGSVQLESQPWTAELALRHWPAQDDGREGRTVVVSAVGARAAVLYRVAPALNALAGLEINRLGGEGGAAVRQPGADVAWQLAPVLGLSMITMDIGYLRLELGGLARLALVRPTFVVTGFGTLYRAPALGADAIIRGVLAF